MFRTLLFFALLACAALGASWLSDQQGTVELAVAGKTYSTSLAVGAAFLLAVSLIAALALIFLRFVFTVPSQIVRAGDARRHRKGLHALSRGIVAIGAGDRRQALRAADEAQRFLPNEPLTLLLQAQSAQLRGEQSESEKIFQTMLLQPETRLVGLRGLYLEAHQRGDDATAQRFAAEAERIKPLPWAGEALLAASTKNGDWLAALSIVESNISHGWLDHKTADRQRAVLNTAIAQEHADKDPALALQRALDALKYLPGFDPAAALAGRLYARRADIRKASRVLEAAWIKEPHPDLARIYLDVRPGDSTKDRLARAQHLLRLAPQEMEAYLTVANAAIDARDFATARKMLEQALYDLEKTHAQPTVRLCMAMARLEETEHGATGAMREWLAKASHAKPDPAWVADGFVSDSWAPVSPVTGALDAFRWQVPQQQMSGPLLDWEPVKTVEETKVLEILPMAAPGVTGEALVQVTKASVQKGAEAKGFSYPRPDDPGPERSETEAAKPAHYPY